jgi:type VI protein secretion system component VasK
MYIIAIAWVYVVVMIAVVSDSWLKGIVRFVFLGVIPIGMLMWLTVRRRRGRMAREAEKAQSQAVGDSAAKQSEP